MMIPFLIKLTHIVSTTISLNLDKAAMLYNVVVLCIWPDGYKFAAEVSGFDLFNEKNQRLNHMSQISRETN